MQVEGYLEQYVWLPNNHWKNILHNAAMPACIVAGAFAFIFMCWTFLLEDPRYHSTSDYILIVVLIVLAGLAFLAKKFLGESMDYIFSAGDFTIARILDESRRVKLAAFSMEKVEIFACTDHADYAKYMADPDTKKVKGYMSEDEKLYFVVYHEDDKRVLVTFQPNAEMVQLLAAANPEVSSL